MKKIILFSIPFFFLTSNAYAAISFDAAGGGSANPSLTLTLTQAIAATNETLYVSCLTQTNSPTDISTVTYNLASMTRIGQLWDSTSIMETVYAMNNPDVGTHNVIVTTGNLQAIFCSSEALAGTNQAHLYDASSSQVSGSSPFTQNLSVPTDSSWLVAGVTGDASGLAAGAGTTSRDIQNSQEGIFDSNGPKTPVGTYSLSITHTGGANMSFLLFSIDPAAGGGGGGGGGAIAPINDVSSTIGLGTLIYNEIVLLPVYELKQYTPSLIGIAIILMLVSGIFGVLKVFNFL